MSIYDPSIFKAYDIRGLYPAQMNEKVAYAAGQAFVALTGAKRVISGRDVRPSGVSLQKALIQGITDAGATAIDVGVISTEMLYFAAGTLECDGGMSITASHNPAGWNGIKFCGKNAVAMSRDDLLGQIYDFINSDRKIQQFEKGSVEQVELLPRYVEYLKKYVSGPLPEVKIVANTNFGANGKIVDAVTAGWPAQLIRMNWEEDGSFPKGAPNPFLPKNRQEVSERILAEKADFGVAWDADADRCFLFDDQGRYFPGAYVITILIEKFLKKEPGSTIVLEPRLIWGQMDVIGKNGGKESFCRVGHSYIKKAMREENAVFCGENSGHYYYRDFFYCDNGMITFLLMLEVFAAEIAAGRLVSQLLDDYAARYPIEPNEMNFHSERGKEIIEAAAARYKDGQEDRLDGISIEYPSWRFNLRISNTEPLVRLSMEARTTQELAVRKSELLDFMKEEGAQLQDDN